MPYSPQLFRIAILAFLALGAVVMGSNANESSLLSTDHDEEVATTPVSYVQQAATFSSLGESEAEELPLPAAEDPGYVDDPQYVEKSSCYHNPSIIYRQRIRARKFYGCDPAEDAIMIVEHPGCGCSVEVPVCLPTCLEGMPTVKSRCTPGGRGIVNFCWTGGFNFKVVFRKKGDLVVTYMPLIQ